MGLLSRLPKVKLVRQDPTLSLTDYANYFTFQNLLYGPPLTQTLVSGDQDTEQVEQSFKGFVDLAYKRNPIIFTCITVRQLVFSEARFQFQRMRSGKPGDLFGNTDLGILERPWPNATTRTLLSRMEQDATIAGNSYTVRIRGMLRRLRPDWVAILLGSRLVDDPDPDDPSIEPVGYLYFPGGPSSGKKPQTFLADEVAHYAPIPDPLAHYRGQSWLTPVIREIVADSAATQHKGSFFEKGATPNMIVKFAQVNPQDFDEWVRLFRENYEGAANAYKTMFLGGGADATVVGANLRQVDFKATVGSGETRIAAAAGLPPVIAGFSEGLAAATYSNYHQARRRFSDGTLSPLWGFAAGALESVIRVPDDARLWYDTEGIPFLQDDALDTANILKVDADSIRTLSDGGYDPDSVVEAVTARDLSRLVHTGMPSVQVQPGKNGGPPEKAPGEVEEGAQG